jgi:hypothetical protein
MIVGSVTSVTGVGLALVATGSVILGSGLVDGTDGTRSKGSSPRKGSSSRRRPRRPRPSGPRTPSPAAPAASAVEDSAAVHTEADADTARRARRAA